jgi:hypothetical protein
MLAFYERRTNEHIERVRRCLTLEAAPADTGQPAQNNPWGDGDSPFYGCG